MTKVLFDAEMLEHPEGRAPFRVLDTLPVDEKYRVTGNDLVYGYAKLRHVDAPPYKKGEHTYLQRETGNWPQMIQMVKLKVHDGDKWVGLPRGAICYVSYGLQLQRETRKGRKNRWRNLTGRSFGIFTLYMPEPGMAKKLEELVMAHCNATYDKPEVPTFRLANGSVVEDPRYKAGGQGEGVEFKVNDKEASCVRVS